MLAKALRDTFNTELLSEELTNKANKGLHYTFNSDIFEVTTTSQGVFLITANPEINLPDDIKAIASPSFQCIVDKVVPILAPSKMFLTLYYDFFNWFTIKIVGDYCYELILDDEVAKSLLARNITSIGLFGSPKIPILDKLLTYGRTYGLKFTIKQHQNNPMRSIITILNNKGNILTVSMSSDRNSGASFAAVLHPGISILGVDIREYKTEGKFATVIIDNLSLIYIIAAICKKSRENAE